MAENSSPQDRVSSTASSKNSSPSQKSAKVTGQSGVTEIRQPERDSWGSSTIVVPTFSKSLPPQLLRSYHKSLEADKEAAEVLGQSDSFLVISNVHKVNKYGQRDLTTYNYHARQEKEKEHLPSASGSKRLSNHAASYADSADQTRFQEDSAIASSELPNPSSGVENGKQYNGSDPPRTPRYSSFGLQTYETNRERHIDGIIECTTNVAKFQKSDIFVAYKKTAIKSYLDVKLSALPNMDHDEILWHDLHIEASLKGHLLINVQNSVTTCELATKTEVNYESGWAHCLQHKRRKFNTGQLNYYCHLILAENLRNCRRKDIDVRVSFELYPRDADQYDLTEEWDDETHLMVVKAP